MVDSRLVGEWLDKADEDYQFATSVIESSTHYAQLCFHYHQAAEKYLKAFIVAQELEFVKTHDLILLHDICMNREQQLADIKQECTMLNGYYIETRYPVHWPAHHTREDALGAKKSAEKISAAIRAYITS